MVVLPPSGDEQEPLGGAVVREPVRAAARAARARSSTSVPALEAVQRRLARAPRGVLDHLGGQTVAQVVLVDEVADARALQ